MAGRSAADVNGAQNIQNPVPSETRQYKSIQEYSRVLQQWIWQYHYMSSAQSFYSMMPFSMPPQPSPGIHHSTHINPFLRHRGPNVNAPGGSVPNAQNVPTSSQQQGTVYIIPSVWKRMGAELIDFFILFYIKLMIFISVSRQLGIFESTAISFNGLQDGLILDSEDLEKLLSLSPEIIALEVFNRICIIIVETLCLRRGIGIIGGATPGKRILGMCVVQCDDVIDLGNGRVRVQPATNIGIKRALVRSIIKNFTFSFFFPACFTIFIFEHYRAAYDVVAGTIVVQPQNFQQRQQ